MVEIYNVTGAKVATIYNGNAEAGITYKADFNGESFATGIYYCRVTAGDYSYYNKLILIK